MNIKRQMLRFNIKPDKNRLWKNIEAFLPTDDFNIEINRNGLLKGIENLPVVHPDSDIWERIKNKIRVETSHSKIYLNAAAIAASIIIIFALYIIYSNRGENLQSKNISINKPVNEVEAFLTSICNNNPNKCKNPEFLELKNEILTLHIEKTQINNQVFYNQKDPDMKNTMIKIDEQIITLKKQIQIYVSL